MTVFVNGRAQTQTSSVEFVGPFSYLDAGGEQTVYESLLATRRQISVLFDLSAMTQDGTIRLKMRVDGSTFRLYDSADFKKDEDDIYEYTFIINQAYRLTYEEKSDEGADRSIAFNVTEEALE